YGHRAAAAPYRGAVVRRARPRGSVSASDRDGSRLRQQLRRPLSLRVQGAARRGDLRLPTAPAAATPGAARGATPPRRPACPPRGAPAAGPRARRVPRRLLPLLPRTARAQPDIALAAHPFGGRAVSSRVRRGCAGTAS